MAEWNERTGVTTWARDERACTMHVLAVPAGDPLLHGHSAYTWPDVITFANGFYGLELRNVALHELGHTANLAHSEDLHDVMFPSVSADVVTLSERDLAEFHRVNF